MQNRQIWRKGLSRLRKQADPAVQAITREGHPRAVFNTTALEGVIGPFGRKKKPTRHTFKAFSPDDGEH
eukprot:12891218-Prorocentrum_lima.AAC.1